MDELLEKFGKAIVSEVRDIAVATALKSLRGQMKNSESKELNLVLGNVPDSTRRMIETFATDLVDSTMHSLLSFFDGNSEFFIACKEDDETLIDISEVSDGLAGELFTEEGWINRFSDVETLLE